MDERTEESGQRIPLRERLAAAQKENRTLSPEELEKLKATSREEFEDHQGTVDAVRTTYVKILQIEANLSGQLGRTPIVAKTLAGHRAFIADCLRDLAVEGFPQEEVVRVEGAGMFRALMDFVNTITTHRELEFAIREAVTRENLCGPVPTSEAVRLKEARKPMLYSGNDAYTPFFPEKKAIRALMSALYAATHRVKANERRRESERTAKAKTTAGMLALCFRKPSVTGTTAFMFSWQSRNRTSVLYMELKFDEESVEVLDATGEFSVKIGDVYPRSEIPGPLKAAIHRGMELQREGRGKVIPLRKAE